MNEKEELKSGRGHTMLSHLMITQGISPIGAWPTSFLQNVYTCPRDRLRVKRGVTAVK